uniref:Selenoprotein F n=2 Tax=Plectus sambesii TaxID=2011161 RepID=A0A914XE44_9BILA
MKLEFRFVQSCVLLQSLMSVILASAALSADECKKAGFTGNLLCSTCTDMKQFELEKLVDTCNKCCTDDSAGGKDVTKYPLAHIEICECNLARFPQVQAFVKSDKVKRWGEHVRVRHVRGTLPAIRLMDEYGETQQTLNIEKWDTDTITDFINTWVEY